MRASLLVAGMVLGCGEQKFVVVNAEPDVTITSHDDGNVVGEGERTWFFAIVDDADDAEDELVATWTVGDRVVCEREPVSDFGETNCEIQLADDEREVAVYVEDPRGSNGGDAVRRRDFREMLPGDIRRPAGTARGMRQGDVLRPRRGGKAKSGSNQRARQLD